MHVAMIGTGYVGLVSAACFSEFGDDVVCVDTKLEKIEGLKAGKIPIYEPGLEDLVSHNVAAGRLNFTTDIAEAVPHADVVMLAVGTPSRRGDGHADLSFVYAAAEEVADAMNGYSVVVTKSTVPVGTGDEIARIIRARRPDAEFDIVSNPEFLREGAAISDFMRPDRVVVGVESERAKALMAELYRPLFLIETPVVFTGVKTAELIKYAANTFLATKITFINEIADICEEIGADVHDVAKGIGLDGRIGNKFLHPGPGYGGSCFPKDTLAFVRIARECGTPSHIVEAVVDINEKRKARMAQKIIEACGGSVDGKTVAVLGVAFKPNTDDVRDSASLTIIPALKDKGATVHAYDPEAMEEAKQLLPGVEWCADAYAAMEGADVLVILTEWNEFRALDLERVKQLLASPLIVDLRNIYQPDAMAADGFEYISVGRAVVQPADAGS
ncbi:MAG: UDP-glucose/GDP-mannose dehydrogenase family protein [Alphaproteobacteria bacterium]|jgi:UDPglucose 6-dehydrogenase|nr:UDP-glucose/GDP-mannose dehydrogenase family protein [Alphaproteobacteria bacterium]